MKAILVNREDELRIIFKQLSDELHNIQPKNIKQEKRTYTFKSEVFYDIQESKQSSSHVDVTFKFKEEKYGTHDVVLTLLKNFFIPYEDLNRHNLNTLKSEDLTKIREFAESIQDYEMCIEIREAFKN